MCFWPLPYQLRSGDSHSIIQLLLRVGTTPSQWQSYPDWLVHPHALDLPCDCSMSYRQCAFSNLNAKLPQIIGSSVQKKQVHTEANFFNINTTHCLGIGAIAL